MLDGAAGKSSRRAANRSARAERCLRAARGYLELDMGQHALDELAKIEHAEPLLYEVLRLQADALRTLGRFGEATRCYTRALAERPDSLPALMGAAACYRRLGQAGRSIAAMEDANRLHPEEPAVLFALARFYTLAGETSRGLRWLREAVRRCPDVAIYAEADPDFAVHRSNPHFRLLIESARARELTPPYSEAA